MKVNTKSLIASLNRVMDVVDTSGTLLSSPSQNFHFRDNELQAHTRTMRARTSLPEGFSLTCSVEAKPLYTLLSTLTNDEVDLTFKNGKLKIVAGGVRASRPAEDSPMIREFTIEESAANNSLCTNPTVIQSMIEGMKYSQYAVLKGGAGVTGGLHIDEDVLMTTDRRRIMVWTIDETIKGLKCTLPMSVVDILTKFKDSVTKISFTKRQILQVQLDENTLLESNTLQGDYPNLLQYIPKSDAPNAHTVQFDRTLNEPLKRHIKFLKMTPVNDKEINLMFEDTRCVMSSSTKNTGELYDDIELPIAVNERLSLDVHPAFLQDIIAVSDHLVYHSAEHVVVVNAGKLQYLLQVKY